MPTKRNRHRFVHLRAAVLASALAAALPAGAGPGAPPNVTDGEMALIPPYCPDTQGFKYGDAYSNTSPRAAYWVGLMGRSFWAVHHYCWALINLLRAQQAGVPRVIRRGTLEAVAGDMDYVLRNAAPDFVLMPEILTRYADVQLLLDSPAAAYDAYMRAWTLRPDYWLPYLHWADVLEKSNQKAEARQLIAAGLAYSPTAQPLRERYRRLGGDPAQVPSKAPAAKAAPPEDAPSPAAATAPAASTAAP